MEMEKAWPLVAQDGDTGGSRRPVLSSDKSLFRYHWLLL